METTTTEAKTLKQTLDADIKSAMLSKDNVTRDILRVIKAEISREEAGLKDYKDDDVIRVIKKSIKNLEIVGNDSAKQEIAILQKYIPQQFSFSEIENNVKGVITEINATTMKDMGKVISTFNDKYKGMADGKTVSEIVRKLLQQ